ncbi:MAG: CBS domain-containing protein [candidate division Zixibacteria bacterium]|nr:CBS domain-containing protein [candidate division Zixibacteria bacterium]
MQVKDILDDYHRHPITIQESDTLGIAMDLLEKNKIGALLVCNSKEEPVGILTERDILRNVYANRTDISSHSVKDNMSTNLVIGVPDDHIEYIAKMITENRIRHIPIIDDNNKLCGIVSIGDIVKAKVEKAEGEVRYLQEYITGRQHTANE